MLFALQRQVNEVPFWVVNKLAKVPVLQSDPNGNVFDAVCGEVNGPAFIFVKMI